MAVGAAVTCVAPSAAAWVCLDAAAQDESRVVGAYQIPPYNHPSPDGEYFYRPTSECSLWVVDFYMYNNSNVDAMGNRYGVRFTTLPYDLPSASGRDLSAVLPTVKEDCETYQRWFHFASKPHGETEFDLEGAIKWTGTWDSEGGNCDLAQAVNTLTSGDGYAERYANTNLGGGQYDTYRVMGSMSLRDEGTQGVRVNCQAAPGAAE